MNEITLHEAREEIGPDPYSKLDRLKFFFGDDFEDPGKMVQSIITRSELELFGLSVPRFAIRLYLKNGGFINCRRNATLVKSFHINNSDEWGNRYNDEAIQLENRNSDLGPGQEPHESIALVMDRQSCIADGLLPEPRRLSRFRFKYIDVSSTKLSEAYAEGEVDQLDPNRYYLPYTQTMNLCGGQCAQAVIFIATAILSPFSKSVHGIAEITCLAHEGNCRELTLGSLDPDSMARYFGMNNLRMSEQCLTFKPSASISPIRAKHWEGIIRCYLHSGMPVILPTNTKKLARHPNAENSIYRKNALRISEKDLPKDEHHVLIIVGSAIKDETFVFHDTTTMPFLVATGAELANAGATRDHSGAVSDNGVIMPVVPKPVTLPLLDQRIYEPDPQNHNLQIISGIRFGLDALSRMFHFYCEEPCPAQPNHSADRFHLIRSDRPNARFSLCAEEYQVLLECGVLRALASLEERHSWHKPHWLWLEIFPNSVWLWDAEAPPLPELPENEDEMLRLAASRYLLSTVHVHKDNPRTARIAIFSPS